MNNLRENEAFNKYIDAYKKLSLKDKQNISIKELKELIAFFSEIDKTNNNGSILYNREILDVEKHDSSEDDFVEAVFVYINSLKELIGDYFNRRNL